MRMAKSTDVKTHFGEYLDIARTEPVVIQKNGRNSAVIISMEEYERFQVLEDKYWGELAKAAEQQGTLGPEESLKALQQLMAEQGKAGENP